MRVERHLDPQPTAEPSRSVVDLLQDTAAHTETVVRGEIRLAVLRIQDQLAASARRLLALAIGGVLAVFALVLLLVSSVLLLSHWLDPWVATAIVGLAVALAGGMVITLSRTSDGDSS